MREIGADAGAGRRCPGWRGTCTQVDARNTSCPCWATGSLRLGAGRALRVMPGGELLRFQGDDVDAMCACWKPQNSAHWPAYTPARAAMSRASWCMPGDQVLLAVQVRHPEAVDHVVGGQLSDGACDRNVQLVGGTHASLPVARRSTRSPTTTDARSRALAADHGGVAASTRPAKKSTEAEPEQYHAGRLRRATEHGAQRRSRARRLIAPPKCGDAESTITSR